MKFKKQIGRYVVMVNNVEVGVILKPTRDTVWQFALSPTDEMLDADDLRDIAAQLEQLNRGKE